MFKGFYMLLDKKRSTINDSSIDAMRKGVRYDVSLPYHLVETPVFPWG